jgi:hypothetical protein
MKAMITALMLTAAPLSAETCEDKVFNTEVYSFQAEFNKTFLGESKLAMFIANTKLWLEVSALCDVLEGRGQKSAYWKLPHTYTEEDLRITANFLNLGEL